MAVTQGQALALGNISSIDRSKPVTQAVLNKQRIDLAKEEQAAKQRREAEQERKMLTSMLKFGGKGGFSPFFQEQANKITLDGIQQQMRAYQQGDAFGIMQSQGAMQTALDNLSAQDKAYQDMKSYKKQGYLFPAELEESFAQSYSQGNPKIQKILSERPEYANIVAYDPATGTYSFNAVKNIDLNKEAQQFMESTRQSMKFQKKGKTIDANTVEAFYGHPNEVVEGFAVTAATDPERVMNLEVKEPAKFKAALMEVEQVMPNVDPQIKRQTAAAKLLSDIYRQHNVFVKSESRPMYSGGFDTNLNFNTKVTAESGGNKVTIKRMRTNFKADPDNKGTIEQVDEIGDFNVSTGSPFGFKAVKVLQTRGDGVINLDGNTSLKGQPVQEVEIGQVRAMPVATKRLKDKTGKYLEVGELVDEDRMESAKKYGAVKYIPMFQGTAKVGSGTKSKDISVAIPAEQISRSALISQSRDDVGPTKQSIQSAIDEATEMNRKLPKTGASKSKRPLPEGKPRRGRRGNTWYVWDETTGKYEPE